MLRPPRLEGELALGGDSLGGQGGQGDGTLLQGPSRIPFQGPPQLDIVPRAGEIQQAGQSGFPELVDFWRELNLKWKRGLCKRVGAKLEAWETRCLPASLSPLAIDALPPK